MKKYEAYKPSGIDWIGDVPKDWGVIKLKYKTLSLKSGGTPSSGNESFYSEDGTPWVAIADMSNTDYVYDTDKKVTEEGIKDKSLTIYPEGTLLYSIYATLGKVSVLKVPATINQAILAIALKGDYNQSFLKYNFKAMENYVFSLSNGNTQYNLNAEKVANFFIVDCPLAEQIAIVNYLDAKCAKIDTVVAVQQKRIELLKELKQSIITHAVTKGLDKNAKMKDSGIDWIGEVPEGWEVKRLKYFCTLYGRIGYRGYNATDLVSEDDGAITLSPSNMKDGKMDYDNCTYLSWEKYYESPEIMIENGDVLMVKTGSTYGKTSLVEDLPKEATINPQIVVVKQMKCSNKFLNYVCQTPYFKALIDNTVIGSTIPTIGQEKMQNYPIVLPPHPEQNAIAAYLDKRCATINKQIQKVEKQIELLKEYKKSVITECVTGKRKVF